MPEDNQKVYVMRHGETEWSLSGRHTGITDVPLTENGRRLAKLLQPIMARQSFGLVLASPLQRARETCQLSGLGDQAVIEPDLVEWNYGDYEGLTPQQIHEHSPEWLIFEHGCPGGEKPGDVAVRVDRVINKARAIEGNVALFAHGYVLRVLAARWLGLPPQAGRHFLLDTATLNILGYYRGFPAVQRWNAQLSL